MDARGFFKNHLNTVFKTHPLKRLFPLKIIFLVDLVQILDFLAPFVLLSEITEVSVNLFFSLFDSISDLSSLFAHFIVFHLLDLIQAIMVMDFVWIDSRGSDCLCNFSSLALDFDNFVAIIQHALLLPLLFFFLFALSSLLKLFSTRHGPILLLFQLSFFRLNLLFEGILSA